MGVSCNVASACSQTVMIRVQNEKSYMKEGAFNLGLRGGAEGVSVGMSIGTSGKWEWERVTKGFTNISPKSYIGFDTDLGARAYVSAIMRSTLRVTAVGYPVASDYSVIVKADGTLIEAEYGKIWVDKNGRQHCPTLPNS